MNNINPDEYRSRDTTNSAFNAKNISELIDSDKRGFVCKRICQTFLGPYRLMASEDDYAPWFLHLYQALLYLITPIFTFLPALFISDVKLAMAVGGIVPFLVNLACKLISKLTKSNHDDSSDLKPCSKKALHFIFPPTIRWSEVTVSLFVTLIYGMALAAYIHPYRDPQTLTIVAPLAVTFFTGYSLFSTQIPESTPYVSGESFHIYSQHYQRIYWQLILLLADYYMCIDQIWNLETNYYVEPYINPLLFVLVYFLQAFGLLGNPFVLSMWLLEQTEVFIFGSTYRCADVRIFLSFALNLLIFHIPGLILKYDKPWTMISMVVITFITSHNCLHTLGMKKPPIHKGELIPRTMESIIFSPTQSYQQSDNKSYKQIILAFCLNSFLPGLIYTVIVGIISFDLAEFDQAKTGLLIASFSMVFMLIAFILSTIQRRSLWRIIPCPLKTITTPIPSLLLKYITTSTLVFGLTFALNQQVVVFDNVRDNMGIIVLVYRAYHHTFHHPYQMAVEVAQTYLYVHLTGNNDRLDITLVAFAFINSRLILLVNKLDYVLVSLVTAVKNKKQRFKGQVICFVLQFTLFLPVFVVVLGYSVLFDTATVPFLGFAYFVVGTCRPKKGWHSVHAVPANPRDEKSDGAIYSAMMPQIRKEIGKIMDRDQFLFREGSIYLLKNEKMILLIHTLERGNNYLVFTIKCTELQETTICHAEENASINTLSETTNKSLPFNFTSSLTPLKHLSLSIYEDSKVSLTGIIDNPDFASLYKTILMRCLIFKFGAKPSGVQWFTSMQGEDRDLRDADQVYDREFVKALRVKEEMYQLRQAQESVSFNNLSSSRQPVMQEGKKREKTFLDELRDGPADQWQVQTSAVAPVLRKAPAISKPKEEEKQGWDELEDALEGLTGPPSKQQFIQQPKQNILTDKNSKFNDLDDLDDLIDEVNQNTKLPPIKHNLNSTKKVAPAPATRDVLDEIDDGWGISGVNKASTHSSKQDNSKQSDFEGGQSEEFESLCKQTFTLLMTKKQGSLAQTISALFKGEWQAGNSKAFVTDPLSSQHRYLALDAARLAFHYSLESFIMGEFEVSRNHQQVISELKDYEKEWFFGGEPAYWNEAIKRNLPNLERIIQKKGQFFAHRLRFGTSEDTQFYMYKFREEVARSIWANMTIELYYYTNANDERFSIQAEKDILRNLLVQLAEIPLGYPAFSSGAIPVYY